MAEMLSVFMYLTKTIRVIFMTMVVTTFFLVSPTILGLPYLPSVLVASALTLAALARFVWWKGKIKL